MCKLERKIRLEMCVTNKEIDNVLHFMEQLEGTEMAQKKGGVVTFQEVLLWAVDALREHESYSDSGERVDRLDAGKVPGVVLLDVDGEEEPIADPDGIPAA